MTVLDVLSILFSLAGAFFFLAGTIGLLRFPDTCTRLHAITKADNLGLGLLVVALALQAESWLVVGKLVLIWLLALLASTNGCFLLGRWTLRHQDKEEQR
jgi:multicomponent Na+:H+ antiporter subunit G